MRRGRDTTAGHVLSSRNVVTSDQEGGGIAGNVVAGNTVTLPAMSRRRRRLDQRSLLPRDYLREPFRFGTQAQTTWVLPAGGDRVSQQVAIVQHAVSAEVRRLAVRSTAREVSELFGFSKQYWSLCLLGRAWMGETILAAGVSVMLSGTTRRTGD